MKQSEKNKLEYEGKILPSNNCGDFKVLEYRSTNDVLIEFINTGTKISVWLGNIKKGTIKDPYYPSVYNIGYIGEGEFKSKIDRVQPTYYKRWKEMISRCYNVKDKEYSCYGGIGVRVCDEWLNFQNYAKWWIENCPDESFSLDKDILEKGNKLYSPDKCCFVPKEINSSLTFRKSYRGDLPLGVSRKGNKFVAQAHNKDSTVYLGLFDTPEEAFNIYKQYKKTRIEEYANKYKEILDSKVYNALMNFELEITD